MSQASLLDSWARSLRADGRSTATIEAYLADSRHLIKHVGHDLATIDSLESGTRWYRNVLVVPESMANDIESVIRDSPERGSREP